MNTLNLITTPPEDLYGHTIEGNIIIGNNNVPICPECNVNEKRVSLSFSDPTRTAVDGLSGEIIIRRVDVGNLQKIKIWLRQVGNITYLEGTTIPYDSFNVPWGEYILTKVN